METLQLLLDKYLSEYCLKRNFTDQTMKSKTYILRRFLRDTNISNAKELTNSLIDKWQIALLKSDISPRTINVRTAHILAFLKWCEREGIRVPANRHYIETVNPPPVSRKFYTPKQVARVIRMCRTERERLLIAIGFEAGLRLNELAGLSVYMIKGNEITIEGKGRHIRPTFIREKTAERLQEWIIRNGIDSYIFPSQMYPDKPISVDQARLIMKNAFKRAGLCNMKPHELRYSFATAITDNGADLITAQKLLGHRNVRTTGLYIQRPAERLRLDHARFLVYQ